MNLFFVISTVVGVLILACHSVLYVLGFAEESNFPEGELDVDLDVIAKLNEEEIPWNAEKENGETSRDTAVSGQGGTRSSLTLSRLRGFGLAVTFFGLMGSAAAASHFTKLQTFGSAGLAAIVAYLIAVFLLRQTALALYEEATSPEEEVVVADGDNDSIKSRRG